MAMKKASWPEYIFGFALLAVFASLIIFYLVDLRNVFGLRDLLFSIKHDYFFFAYQPFFFQHWGRNSGFAEILQWFFLGGAAVTIAFIAGRVKFVNKRLFAFAAIMSLAFVLMLLEDAGNIRHFLMSYVQAIFDEPDQGVAGTLTEFFYFAVLAAIPVYALLRHWKDLQGFAKTKVYFLIGFISYGLATSLSFIGTAFEGLLDKNVYTILGEKAYQIALSLGDADLASQWQAWEQGSRFSIGFFLMDSFVEESIEIVAAGAILAAVVSLLFYLKSKDIMQ